MEEPLTGPAADIPALGLLLRLTTRTASRFRPSKTRRSWDSALPLCLALLDHYAGDPAISPAAVDPLFFLIHLCGELRETRAYRPLMRFLSIDPERLEPVLGDAITETIARVVTNVFDGDPEPIRNFVLDEQAEEMLRGELLEALAFLTAQGRIDRAWMIAFLRDCDPALLPRQEHHVWHGWQSAIVYLGVGELADAARQAFRDGRIDPIYMDLDDFERDWQARLAGDGEPAHAFSAAYFGETVAELSPRFSFSRRSGQEAEDEDPDDPFDAWGDEGGRSSWLSEAVETPAHNPTRGVGRNDPCPCGSGKKFKKCCLGKM